MRCKHCGIRLDPEYVAYEADECPYCGEPTTVEMKIQARIEMKEGEDVESVRFVTNLAGVHGLRDDIDEIIKEMETGLI